MNISFHSGLQIRGVHYVYEPSNIGSMEKKYSFYRKHSAKNFSIVEFEILQLKTVFRNFTEKGNKSDPFLLTL